MSIASPVVVLLGLSLVICLAIHLVLCSKVNADQTARLPPGPKPLPLLGNLFDIPRKSPWKAFAEWSREYGEVVYLNVLGRPIVLLNSVEATSDLLEGRFGIYSDRPNFPLANLIGHQWNFGFMPYGQKWRSLRRMFDEKYSAPALLRTFYDSHRSTVAKLLQNILRDPDEFSEHLKLRSGQLIIDVTYGISVVSAEHPLVRTAEAVMDVTSVALSPAMWLVNPAAIMHFIPGWLGGSNMFPQLQRWRSDLEDLRNKPFNTVKEYMARGLAKSSYTAYLLQELSPAEGSDQEAMIRDTAAIAFGAALETTIISGEVFLLAIALYPEVQMRAQEEIDKVIGAHRLPDYIDRERLPYLSAVMKEVLRWHPPAPTGIPHLLRQDDSYKGFRIPGGSVVMGNIWGILHDPDRYPDPLEFKPERFLRDGAFDCRTNDPSRYVFGFGRRVCPGKLFSEDSIWLTVAQFLAVYSVSLVDKSSPPPVEFVSGAISRPVPFKCVIRPRSEVAKDLIECATRD